MLRKFSFWIFAFGLFTSFVAEVSAQAPAPAPAPAPAKIAGIITAKLVTGTVTVQDNVTKTPRPLQEKDQVQVGDTVITGKSRNSGVVLVFSNGATVTLKADSELNIAEFLQEAWDTSLNVAEMTAEPSASTTNLHLARGELIGTVAKLNKEKGSSFNVQTPVGAAGIRGTTFRVVFRPDPANPGHYTFTVSKPEGNVNVTMQGATGTVSAPVSVADNREVVVSVQGTVNATTGQITVTAPPQIITQSIPPATAAIITTAAVQAVQASKDVVIPPAPPQPTTPQSTTPTTPTTPDTTPTTTTTTTTNTTPTTTDTTPATQTVAPTIPPTTPTTPTTPTLPTPTPPAPPPVQAPPRTTSGAGG
jgi:hypothetical protein